MAALWLVALAFAAVIVVGTAAVALNDALERWWANLPEPGERGGSEPTALVFPSPRAGRGARAGWVTQPGRPGPAATHERRPRSRHGVAAGRPGAPG